MKNVEFSTVLHDSGVEFSPKSNDNIGFSKKSKILKSFGWLLLLQN